MLVTHGTAPVTQIFSCVYYTNSHNDYGEIKIQLVDKDVCAKIKSRLLQYLCPTLDLIVLNNLTWSRFLTD